MKPYRCAHCNQRLVILETRTGSYLPMEIPEGEIIITDEEFDGTKHVSHLKKCEPLRNEWGKKKKKFVDRNNPFAFLDYKALLK